MFIPIDKMPKSSRVWIYQANRAMRDDEKAIAGNRLHTFVNTWAAHGQPLNTSFDIRYNFFLILAVDESTHGASGCSIDSSVHIVKELGASLNIDFFDRSKVAMLHDDEVKLLPQNQIKSLILKGEVTESATMFNNLVENIEAYESEWILPVGDSWLKRFFSLAN